MAQLVKNPPAMWETWVRSLGGQDPLEKEITTHSGILAWRIPWTEEPAGLQSMGSQRADMTEQVSTQHTHTSSVCVQFSEVEFILSSVQFCGFGQMLTALQPPP